MNKIIELAKEHPIPAAIGAGILLLLVIKGGSGSSNSAIYSPSAQAANVLKSQATAAQTDIALSTINAGSANTRMGYMADIWNNTITSNAGVQIASGKNDVASLIAILGHSDNLAKINSDSEYNLGKLQASQSIAAMGFQNDYAIVKDNNNTKLNLLSQTISGAGVRDNLNAATLLTQSNINAASSRFGIQTAADAKKYELDLNSSNLPAYLHSQEIQQQTAQDNAYRIAVLNGQTTQAVTALNTSAANTTANANAAASSAKSDQNWLSSIASIAGLFF